VGSIRRSGLSGRPLFDECNMEDYAKVLAHCSRFPLEVSHPQPDKAVSWLHQTGNSKATTSAYLLIQMRENCWIHQH
jgi:hypothetical protein